MDEKSKIQMLTVATVLVTVGVLAFLVILVLMEPLAGEFGLLMLLIAAVVVLLPIVLLMKVKRDLKQGFPLVDERGATIKRKAGHYAFMAAIYIILGFMYYDFIFVQVFEAPSLSPTEYFLALDMVLVGVYVAFWWWFTRKGDVVQG